MVLFQSTPLREGRLTTSSSSGTDRDVSIHAPARGATSLISPTLCKSPVSIHAPARGATDHLIQQRHGSGCFNPRPCARGDMRSLSTSRIFLLFQSTPLREGRPAGRRLSTVRARFNPRPCARGDMKHFFILPITWCFNPRPCARGDGTCHAHQATCPSFNPRPCARGDRSTDKMAQPHDMFQSTPLREGRPNPGPTGSTPRCFNPRPCARGDVGCRGPVGCIIVSIHAPARGATPGYLADAVYYLVSIHAPARGATTIIYRWSALHQFQSTPLREGRPGMI